MMKHTTRMDRSLAEMSEEHRRVLRYMRSLLIANLDPDSLLRHLQERGVLSAEGASIVRSKETKPDRCRALLNMLPMRGPHAFGALVHALQQTGQGVIADTLTEQARNPQPAGDSGEEMVVDSSLRELEQHNPNIHRETGFQPTPMLWARQANDLLGYDVARPARAWADDACHVALVINYAEEAGLAADSLTIRNALRRSGVVQSLPELRGLPRPLLLDGVEHLASQLHEADGFFLVLLGSASPDASMLRLGADESVDIAAEIVAPFADCAELAQRPKVFLLLLTVEGRRPLSAAFGCHRRPDCLLVVLRSGREGSGQRDVVVSAFCRSIERFGHASASNEQLMMGLMAACAGPEVEMVSSLPNFM